SDEHIARPGGNPILSQKEGDFPGHYGDANKPDAPISGRGLPACPRSGVARGHIWFALAVAMPSHGISVHAPFCSWTSTRARSSTPKELPALKLYTPCVPTISLTDSIASRNASRNCGVPGSPFVNARSAASRNTSQASNEYA